MRLEKTQEKERNKDKNFKWRGRDKGESKKKHPTSLEPRLNEEKKRRLKG